MMRAHAHDSDSDPESERDEDTPAGALALPPKLRSGREMFCTTRNVTYHSSLRNELPHIFDAALPHKSRIHQDWADSVNPTLLETHIALLLGDKTTLRDPGRSNVRIWRPSSHISVACQNVTGSSQPYSRAGWPNDDCRFAAWKTLVNKASLHAFTGAGPSCAARSHRPLAPPARRAARWPPTAPPRPRGNRPKVAASFPPYGTARRPVRDVGRA